MQANQVSDVPTTSGNEVTDRGSATKPSGFRVAWVVCYLASFGCSGAAPGAGGTVAVHYSGMRASGAVLHSATRAKSPVAGQSGDDLLNDSERQIWNLVERAAENTPDRAARKRSKESDKAAKRGKSAVVSTGAALTPLEPMPLGETIPMDGRQETLRVMGESGAFCAAVSIASRLAVTALHCVRALCDAQHPLGASPLQGCHIRYTSSLGEDADATVVASSEIDLVALLDLHSSQPKYGALSCDDPRAQDPVYTVSHPGGEHWKLAYGRLSRDPIPLDWVQGGSTRVLVAEIPTKRGSSGGGLFDVRDNVVGIQIARFSPWTTDFGKAAFVQADRVFKMAGQYCMKMGGSACVGLRCISSNYDIWSFNR
ncbi:MAG: S1 family peptidase [Myxococcales bacterium]